MLKCFFILFILSLSVISHAMDSTAKWIWRQGHVTGHRETVRFRYEFDLPAAPVAGQIHFSGDDLYKIYINGCLVRNERNFKCQPLDAKTTFGKGKNVITAEVVNLVSSGGLLMNAEFTLRGESSPRQLVTDGSWKYTLGAGNDLAWTKSDFDASHWQYAAIRSSVLDSRNGQNKHIDIKRFLNEKEEQILAGLRESGKKEIHLALNTITTRLKQEKMPGNVRFIRQNGVLYLFDGKRTLSSPFYNSVMLDPRRDDHFFRIRRFHDAGFRVFVLSAPLNECWQADGSVDASGIADRLLHLIAAAPESVVFVHFDLNPPKWFVERYPDELIGYGSGAQPIFSGDHLRVPMARPSMASAVWKEQSGKALSELIRQLAASPAGKRIALLQTIYGIYSEWHYFGMPKELPDTSKPMEKAFRNYLKGKYVTDAALQQAWRNERVTLATAAIPTPTERCARKDGEIRNDIDDRTVLDFDECMAIEINKCQKFFNLTAKRAFPRELPVGNYSGYFFGMGYPACGWQVNTPEMFDSEAMDYQVSPYSYSYRKTGDCGLPRNAFESYAFHGKAALLESDARPHQASDPADGHSKNEAESIGQLSRDFCNALTRGAGMWYYDFAGGWYDRPEYLGLFKKLIQIWDSKPDATRVSEIAIVCDFSSVPYHTAAVNPNRYTHSLISNAARELYKSGAPFDAILMEDLHRSATPQYKLYLFPNLANLTDTKRALLKKLRAAGATLVFLNAPQLANEWRNAEKILFAGNTISREKLRQIIDAAGIHRYHQEPDTVLFASRGLVGIHRATGGKATLQLPAKAKNIERLLPNHADFPASEKIEFDHPQSGTSLFRVEY